MKLQITMKKDNDEALKKFLDIPGEKMMGQNFVFISDVDPKQMEYVLQNLEIVAPAVHDDVLHLFV